MNQIAVDLCKIKKPLTTLVVQRLDTLPLFYIAFTSCQTKKQRFFYLLNGLCMSMMWY